MADEKDKPRRKYAKPEVLSLTTTKALGDCAGGSGDENCYPVGNSASFMCFQTGNAAPAPPS